MEEKDVGGITLITIASSPVRTAFGDVHSSEEESGEMKTKGFGWIYRVNGQGIELL